MMATTIMISTSVKPLARICLIFILFKALTLSRQRGWYQNHTGCQPRIELQYTPKVAPIVEALEC
jgi:hypothetical protein